jgi:hypothetical protein
MRATENALDPVGLLDAERSALGTVVVVSEYGTDRVALVENYHPAMQVRY